MNLLSRLLRLHRTPSRRPVKTRRPALGLGLERLETRWTPAIDIHIDGANQVTITDADSGQIDNKIEIIDDFNDKNTYIRINGGDRVRLNTGTNANGLFQNIKINMGAGDDTVIFTTIGDDNLDDDLNREVDLGAGNDRIVIELGDPALGAIDLGGAELEYKIKGGSGNDTYIVKGGAYDGDFQVNITDTLGVDRYEFDLGDFSDAEIELTITDTGAAGGWQLVQLDFGDLDGVSFDVDFKLTGTSANAVAIGGDVKATDSELVFKITTGAGNDCFTFRDNALDGSDQELIVDLGAGDDVYKAKLNGVGQKNTPALANGSKLYMETKLGVGKDVYRARYHGSTFKIASNGEGDTGLDMEVSGGSGKDMISVCNTGEGAALGTLGDDTFIAIEINGDAGRDYIDVDLGHYTSNAEDEAKLTLEINGGTGGDYVKLAGVLKNSEGLTLTLQIQLGADSTHDTLYSSFRSSAGATIQPTVDDDSGIAGGAEDTFQYYGKMFGQRLRDYVA